MDAVESVDVEVLRPDPDVCASDSACAVAARLPLNDKGGEDTPETCTPPARSLSPSSNGSDKQRSVCDGSLGGDETPAGTDATAEAPAALEVSASGGRAEPEADVAECGSEAEGAEDAGTEKGDKDGSVDASTTNPADEQSDVVSSCAGGVEDDVSVTDRTGGEATSAKARRADCGGDAAANASIATGGARGSRGSGRTGRGGGYGRGGAPLGPNPALDAQAQDFAFPSCPGGTSNHSFSDRRIIDVLAAPEPMHRRLLRVARRVPEILTDPEEPPLVSSAELYGSLALDMSEPSQYRQGNQAWASYYVNSQSDVDFVVEMQKGVSPAAVAQRLIKKGPWRMVGQVQVHKFASTQFTLLGSFDEKDGEGASTEVYLDITCIEQPMHFKRFKMRQEGFRKVFLEVRGNIEGQFGADGALAFDAYIHLLKGFAAKIPGNALTGFQATCIGLFTLQSSYVRIKPTQSIALSLFEGFLRFCLSFYSESPRHGLCWNMFNYCNYAIDLSMGGRWLPRMNSSWRSELYFMGVEVKLQTRPDERMNVTHSLDPARVAAEALDLLNRAFSGPFDWDRISGSTFPGH